MLIPQEWLVNKFENEDQFQAASFKMLDNRFPKFRGRIWHTVNEIIIPKTKEESPEDYKKRMLFFRGRLRAMGMLSGVPDLLILYRGVLYGIELKQPKGHLSDGQKDFHYLWSEDCIMTKPLVCFTMEQVYMAGRQILEADLTVVHAASIRNLLNYIKETELISIDTENRINGFLNTLN